MTSRSNVGKAMARLTTGALLITCMLLSGCGPELTTPGKTNISGTWYSAGPSAGMTSIYVTITQASDGSISGVFTADGTTGLQFCPLTPTCTIGGPVSGSNTVLQVFLDLNNGGLFTGQVMDMHTMKGAMSRGGALDPVVLTRP